MLTVFIDESGTLPDVKDKFIVICGVVVDELKEAKNIFSRILKSLKQRKIDIKEIKFYHAGQNTKRQFLSGISSANFKIFTLVVDKKNRKIADTPENFSVLVGDLIGDIIKWYENGNINFVIDRHFYRKVDQNEFNKLVGLEFKGSLKYLIKDVDSQKNFLVNTADMAAGAILWKYRGKDRQFYDLIKENIIAEKVVSWPEIKRKSIKKITRTGASAHPSDPMLSISD